MNKHQLGRTPVTVTPLGLGLAALGRPGYINLGHGDDLNNTDPAAMEAHAHAVLDAAWAAGIRYLDAARSYGQAEQFLSSWLTSRAIDPADVTIGSKWGYTYTADWQINVPEGQKHELKDHSLAVLQRQLGESRALLGDHLDLYQIHSATLESGVLTNEPVLGELARLRDRGLAIGLSVSGPQQAATIWRALEIQVDGRPLFAAVQATWNVLERSASAALQAAHDAGVGVIIKEALANGRLTSRNNRAAFRPSMALLRQQATTNHTAVDALALAAAVNQPFVDIVLSGAAQVDHLVSNLGALTVDWNPDLAAALAELVEPAAQYWQIRSELAWN